MLLQGYISMIIVLLNMRRITAKCTWRTLEITDLNRIYLENNELSVSLLGDGFTWLDTGTHESLVDATNFVKTIEEHQHRKIACLEEIAYDNGWIDRKQLEATYEVYKKNQYGAYLKKIMDRKYIDKGVKE